MPHCRLFAVAALLPLLLSSQVWAGNRALVIGVGEHEVERLDLPGIDLDVAMIQDVAKNLGFKSSEITTLQNHEATLAAIQRELRVLSSVAPDDRVLVYFSGHGSHIPDTNGDEEDGQDEVLLPHDVRVSGGKAENVLVDDDFARLLAAIPSRHLFLLIDACHSGTATKSFSNLGQRGTPKYVRLADDTSKAAPFWSGVSARNLAVIERQHQAHVLLSAAMDSELAQATPEGSAFTLGVAHAFKAAGGKRQLTPKQLAQGVEDFVKEKLDELGTQPHTPQLSGDPERLNANIFFAKPAIGPMREKLDALVARMTPMRASSPRSTYRVGERLTMTFDVPVGGYLNVVNVDANDSAMVLFPNKFHSDNRVARGPVTIPTPRMRFDIEVKDPRGQNFTYAFLTQKPLDFYKSTVEGRDENGAIADVLVPLSASGFMRARNLVPVAREESNDTHAGKVVLNVQ